MNSKHKLIKYGLILLAISVVIGYLMWPGEFAQLPPLPPEGKEPFTALVISVANGDTITLLKGKNDKLPVRLHGIETPKLAQTYGHIAREATRKWIYLRDVLVTPVSTDEYGRMTVFITLENGDFLQEKLLQEGLAWVYPKTCQTLVCSTWTQEMEKAKQEKKGLWKFPLPVAPWEFQKRVTTQSVWQ